MVSLEKVLLSQVNGNSRVAIHLDNSQQWLQIDDVLTQLGAVIVPIPHFFSPQQISHMINAAGIDVVVCAEKAQKMWRSYGFEKTSSQPLIFMYRYVSKPPVLPDKTHKITFTSGTTSEPKGVCLSLEHLQVVGQSLADITTKIKVKKHLCLLPLSILLENMAANYAAKKANITVITPSLNEIGLSGSSQLDITKLVGTLLRYRPDSMILMPQMLKAIMQVMENSSHENIDLSFLKFIAVGGAVCSKGLLQKAQQLKLPVYEGYGISECGSVITLNTCHEQVGHVGKVLPHQQIKINDESEIMVTGHLYVGYLGDSQQNTLSDSNWYATGDLGELDKNNNLTIIGRKKKVIINSFGRNISPDWVEAELLSINAISQCVVYGEGQPFLTAICVSTKTKQQLSSSVKSLNHTLPDYAQIKQIIISQQAFTIENQMLNASGTLKVQQIFNHFAQQLKEIYANT